MARERMPRDNQPKRHQFQMSAWLVADGDGEAFPGVGTFDSKKITGQDSIDFVKFHQNIAARRTWDTDRFTEAMDKPQE